ncbi:MAG TPA: hypothetical protein PKC18_10850 [Lacipirellulaceae bacterium]|nr:hypothetical protein [Lacipirellulaceae bacterium]
MRNSGAYFCGLVAIASWGAFVGGCRSRNEPTVDARRAALEAYDAGLAAFNSGDFSSAELKFTEAIELRGLGPDAYCDAAIRRAACWAAAGKYDEALAELQTQEESGGPPDQIDVARSFVYRKQGKTGEAQAALARARRFNRLIKEF